MGEINLRSWLEISQAVDDPTAAMLEHILARMARIGARLDEYDRCLSTVHPQFRPKPDPPDAPRLYAAAQFPYQPPTLASPLDDRQWQQPLQPYIPDQSPPSYNYYQQPLQPYIPDQSPPSYNYYQQPPQPPNIYQPPPQQPSDPSYGLPSHWFSDPLPQSTLKAIPTHSDVVSVPNTEGFLAGMVPKLPEPQLSRAVTSLPPGPQGATNIPLFNSHEYRPATDRVCERIGVTESCTEEGIQNQVLRTGCENLSLKVEPLPRNSSADHYYCSYCYGWRRGDKRGTESTWLVDAVNNGAVILTGYKVDMFVLVRDSSEKSRKRCIGVTTTTENKNIGKVKLEFFNRTRDRLISKSYGWSELLSAIAFDPGGEITKLRLSWTLLIASWIPP